MLGVEHFYLFNNLSTDRSLEIIEPYVKSGLVDLFHSLVKIKNQLEMSNLQIKTYTEALEIAKKTSRWIAFIDLDEFIVPKQKDDLVSFLEDYENYPGIIINWQNFGTSGLDTIPEGKLIIESLVLKAEKNNHANHFTKSIVQPNHVQKILGPHTFLYKNGQHSVNSDYKPHIGPILGFENDVIIDKININHYYLGTKEWVYKNKLPRRSKYKAHTKEQIENCLNDSNQIKDDSILKFVPLLRELMFN
jgi:hypothetical protein